MLTRDEHFLIDLPWMLKDALELRGVDEHGAIALASVVVQSIVLLKQSKMSICKHSGKAVREAVLSLRNSLILHPDTEILGTFLTEALANDERVWGRLDSDPHPIRVD